MGSLITIIPGFANGVTTVQTNDPNSSTSQINTDLQLSATFAGLSGNPIASITLGGAAFGTGSVVFNNDLQAAITMKHAPNRE